MFGDQAEIIQPDSLKERIRTITTFILQKNS